MGDFAEPKAVKSLLAVMWTAHVADPNCAMTLTGLQVRATLLKQPDIGRPQVYLVAFTALELNLVHGQGLIRRLNESSDKFQLTTAGKVGAGRVHGLFKFVYELSANDRRDQTNPYDEVRDWTDSD